MVLHSTNLYAATHWQNALPIIVAYCLLTETLIEETITLENEQSILTQELRALVYDYRSTPTRLCAGMLSTDSILVKRPFKL